MRIFLISLLSFLVTKSDICFANESPTPVIRTKQGSVRGITEESINGRKFSSYLGIPFAEPPVGGRRFKAPVPIAPWEDTLITSKYPPNCLQNDFFELPLEDKSSLVPMGVEDCLYLNVHTPKTKDVETKYPVMVFIHGGGFVCGSSDLYQPYILLDQDIILVTIQYRLGIFGFLSTEDSVLPGNMGLKDQQLALKWVHENIPSFGGDNEKITIFGESAGGASVHYQMLSPGSKGLFQRAIIQSGTAFCPWASNTKHREFALKAGRKFGCTIDKGSESFLECMQNADAHKLLELATGTSEFGIAPLFDLPRLDGEFITDYPENLVREGKYHKVDVMTGITKDEGSLIMMMFYINPLMMDRLNNEFDKYGPLSLYFQNYPNGVKMAKKIYDYYLKGKSLSSTTVYDEDLKEIYSDIFFEVCHDNLVTFLAKDEDISLYLYQLDHLGEFSIMSLIPGFDRNNWIGHTEELNYLFHGGHFFPHRLTREDDIKLGHLIVTLWTNFAKTGKPTLSGYPLMWNKATGNNLRKLSLKPDLEMVDYDFSEKRKLWASMKTDANVMLGIYEDKSKTEL